MNNLNLKKELIIWDSKDKINHNTSKVLLWGFSEYHNKIAPSIINILENNSDLIRNKYLEWVDNFGKSIFDNKTIIEHLEIRDSFSYWWMTLISEKCNVSKSSYINEIIKLLALELLIKKKKIKKIILKSNNLQLNIILKNFCLKKNIEFQTIDKKFSNKTIRLNKNIISFIPYFLKIIIWLIYYYLKRLPLKGKGLSEWRNSKKKISFFSYLINYKQTKDNYIFTNEHWGQLIHHLDKKKLGSNWFHHYIKSKNVNSPKKASKLIINYNQNELQTHVTLESFLSIKLIIKTFIDWKNLYNKNKIIKNISLDESITKFDFKNFYIEDMNKSLKDTVAINNLLNFNLIEESLKMLPKQKKGFYIQENQPWEFALLYAWKKYNHGKITGYQSSTIRYWDLRNFYFKIGYQDHGIHRYPRPDKVAINNFEGIKIYQNAEYPKNETIVVEALRYLDLLDFDSFQKKMKRSDNQSLKILIILEGIMDNDHHFLKLIHNIAGNLKEGIKFFIKTHPVFEIKESKYENKNIVFVDGDIKQLICQYDLFFVGNSSSSAIEIKYMRKPVFIFQNSNNLNLSPLKDYNKDIFLYSENDIRKAIQTYPLYKIDKNNNFNFYILDKNLSKWNHLID